ncbi:MAG: response regulator [Bacteroidales bacterium]|nr:response regulator [Bacteroidales bacterium]
MEFSKPKKIFIVDDDEMLTEVLSDYLTRNVPHEISIFHTGEDCLQQISGIPDVIILDFHLNTVNKEAENGLAILSVIRKHLPNIRVIMLSSQENYTIAAKTLMKGAEQYVIKDEDAFEKIAKMLY